MPVISIILFATAVVVMVFTQGRNTLSPAASDQGRTDGIPNEYAS